jgi:hypothetical protein
MGFGAIMKRPSAFLPVAMSCTAIAVVAASLAVFGRDGIRQPDEGTAAHLWQLLMAGQLPIVAYFAITWVPRAPRQALPVLALQAVAGLAALAPVFVLHL